LGVSLCMKLGVVYKHHTEGGGGRRAESVATFYSGVKNKRWEVEERLGGGGCGGMRGVQAVELEIRGRKCQGRNTSANSRWADRQKLRAMRQKSPSVER